uniref:Protein kinase domain-containing protein n=1 Tax=Heterorhabditis bacteriophora TaxID=37862 RepID=A0A1I7WCD6_HETBA
MEMASGGEMYDRVVAKGRYSENEARQALKMLLSGLSYLHSIRVTHRDLKPENLLYSDARSEASTKSTRSIRSVTRSDHGHRVDPREVDQLANDLKRAAQSTKNYGALKRLADFEATIANLMEQISLLGTRWTTFITWLPDQTARNERDRKMCNYTQVDDGADDATDQTRAILASIRNLSEKYRLHMTTNLASSETKREDFRSEELNIVSGTLTSIALLKITLPTFDDNTTEWKRLFQLFSSMIDDNRNLPDIAKLNYLIMSLQGSAA